MHRAMAPAWIMCIWIIGTTSRYGGGSNNPDNLVAGPPSIIQVESQGTRLDLLWLQITN